MSAGTGRHERTDASPRLVGLIAASVAVGIGVALLAAWGIFTAGSRAGAAGRWAGRPVHPRAAGADADRGGMAGHRGRDAGAPGRLRLGRPAGGNRAHSDRAGHGPARRHRGAARRHPGNAMKLPSSLLFACALLAGAARLPAQSPLAYDQRIGERLPLATPLVDELGRTAPLADAFRGRPLLLIFGYYKCPQLCSVVERGTVDALRELGPTVGRDFDLAYLSIDPTDTPADARIQRATAVRAYGRGAATAGWHYLTGPEPAVRAVADAAGFAYRYDPLTRQYAHPSGFVVLTPQGVISQYFLGIDFAPKAVAAALDRAAQGKTGQPVFNLVLECFRGDFITGRYGRAIWRTLQVAVALTVLALFGGNGWMLRQERAAPRPAEGGAA